MYTDPITIPPEEKEQAKAQVLTQMRLRYLTFKSEWLTAQAVEDQIKENQYKKLMDGIVLAYAKVEAEL